MEAESFRGGGDQSVSTSATRTNSGCTWMTTGKLATNVASKKVELACGAASLMKV